MITDINFIVI